MTRENITIAGSRLFDGTFELPGTTFVDDWFYHNINITLKKNNLFYSDTANPNLDA
jgi:hypothetical protein